MIDEVVQGREKNMGTFGAAEMGKNQRGTHRTMKWARCFIISAAVILALTGGAKLFSAFGPARLLDSPDPMFGVPFRHLMLLTGVLEVIVALFCVWTSSPYVSALMISWLSVLFVAYRVGLHWLGAGDRPCGCLGTLTDALRISPQTADGIMKALLGYLLLGSCALLLARRTAEAPSSEGDV
jgi:hypothetical protein